MKKKNLLEMKALNATRSMVRVAQENRVETITEKTSWGTTYKVRRCEYARYFRETVKDGILKVAIFLQVNLEKGDMRPKYEVYCDKSKDEWVTYEVASGRWLAAKIDNLSYEGVTYIHQSNNWQQDGNRREVNDYFNTGANKDIYAAVLEFQNRIRKDQLSRKHRNELEEIDETMREVPDVPKGFEDWIAKNCFEETLFYEPESKCHHRWPRMYCTHCRKWMDTPTDYKERPEHNKETRCPSCGVNAKYKSWNKQKYVTDDTNVGLLQRLKDDTGWILRSFCCRITRKHEKGWEDYEIHVYENERARLDGYFCEQEFFEYGEYKYTGVTRWRHEVRRSSWGYYYSREIGRVVMYTPNLKRELKREAFGRMNLKEIMKGGTRERVHPVNILRKLKQYPCIEYIQKSGLKMLLEEILRNEEYRDVFQRDKERVHEVLGLDKQRFQRLQRLNGGSRTIRALQYEIESGSRVSDENMKFIEEAKIRTEELVRVVNRTGMNMERTINYLRKQQDQTEQDWRSIFGHYEDYLNMAQAFGMDITDEIVCRQPQLMEYHDRYTARKNRAKNKTRDAEVDAKYPKIRENAKKFKERFQFEKDDLVIVVPNKASDITKEGRLQHHCVGASDTYISNMNNERYFILFLRKKEKPEKPYYTLEVTWDGEIKQFYAAYDRQPDKEKIEAILAEFTKEVQHREQELQKKMHEVEERDGTKATRIGTQYYMSLTQEVV